MGTVWQAVANARAAPCLVAWNQDRFLEVTGYSLIFVGAILVLALVVAWVDRWRKRPIEQGTSAGDQLSHFRELYERGELSPEEFARVRGLLSERLRQELQVPPPSPPPPAEIPPQEPPDPGNPSS